MQETVELEDHSSEGESDYQSNPGETSSQVGLQSNELKLSFHDLQYSIRDGKGETVDIIKQTSGIVMPSSTNYIMGASGSGKTSLLNALSGRVLKTKNSELKGSITVNDCIKVTTEVFSNFGCYVMQDDVLFEYFTVKEAI